MVDDGALAIISDIHGNIEALEAVLADIEKVGIKKILNLGDIVGYGPDPEACVDLISSVDSFNLCGNHDYAVLHTAEDFNPVARAAVDFVRQVMKPSAEETNEDKLRRWEWLGNLEPIYEGEVFEAMHGSPRQPITEYVLPSDPEMDPFKIQDIFAAMGRDLAFVGHTHFPGIIEEGYSGFVMPPSIEMTYKHGRHKAIVNVGSIGQPRDRDMRSCYVILDGGEIHYRRVEYDLEKTVQKVRETAALHEICGLRLREGR